MKKDIHITRQEICRSSVFNIKKIEEEVTKKIIFTCTKKNSRTKAKTNLSTDVRDLSVCYTVNLQIHYEKAKERKSNMSTDL